MKQPCPHCDNLLTESEELWGVCDDCWTWRHYLTPGLPDKKKEQVNRAFAVLTLAALAMSATITILLFFIFIAS